MAEFKFLPKAQEDLVGIWDYTLEKWSLEQAERYLRKIQVTCQIITDNCAFGKNYENIDNDLLGFHIGKHIIFCKIIAGGDVEIVRILHEGMDLKTRIHE